MVRAGLWVHTQLVTKTKSTAPPSFNSPDHHKDGNVDHKGTFHKCQTQIDPKRLYLKNQVNPDGQYYYRIV